MTSTCNISSSSPSPVIPSEDDQQHQLYTARPQASSSSISLAYSIQDHGGCYPREPHQLNYQQEANNFTSQGGGPQDHVTGSESERDLGLKIKLSLRKKEDRRNQNRHDSAKWMSSKMKLVRKMMLNSASTRTAQQKLEEDDDHKPLPPLETDSSSNFSSVNSSSNPSRVCADCNTNMTPLWRSGPRGPKSLCNACGIRQRKARRAMAAANGMAVAGETSSVVKTKVQHKDKMKRSNNCDNSTQYTKRSKLMSTSYGTKNKVCFDDFPINLSNNLAFHRVFPQDEKEAAIMLMALSCGIVRS